MVALAYSTFREVIMADNSSIRVSGDSPEAVALALLHEVSRAEGKHFSNKIGDDRKWLLDTYVECLKAAREVRV